MERKGGLTTSTIAEHHCWDIQEDQTKAESGVTQGITDELYSADIQ